MPLINLSAAFLSFGDAPLLDDAQLQIDAGERVCLVGRNGAGKSTLLKVLNQEIALDAGQVIYEKDCVVARLSQDPPRDVAGTVFDFVAEGIKGQAEHIKAWHAISQLVSHSPSEQNLKQMAQLQEILDSQGLWQLDSRIHELLTQSGLDADAGLSTLSGGWLRKAALARALVSQPDVLLLDEPTNHLDIDSISALEKLLSTFQGSLVFISHDRAFIRALATRIVDLDRGRLVSWPGNYALYLTRREAALNTQERHNAEFDRKLAQEEAWIRQGIKARRTRNEGRVRALKALRVERAERRERMGVVSMQPQAATHSGKIVFELEKLSYQVNDKVLVRDFSACVQRGERIALIGPNGCGKTTLLKLMLGQLQADSGAIKTGTRLEVAYFDQHRAQLNPEQTVMDNLAHGSQEVMVNGRSRHVLSYLQDFLFSPKRAMTPVKVLSGGERNRLLLARLFLKPANLLILDEPTNDLDVETLELLEEQVSAWQGTLLMVSHDREFIDNSVTECWFFTGNGVINTAPGGWSDAWHQLQAETQPEPQSANNARVAVAAPAVRSREPVKPLSGKLSYNLQQELAQLPQHIEQLEAEIAVLQGQVNDADFFSLHHAETTQVLQMLAHKEQLLETAFARWTLLEEQKNS